MLVIGALGLFVFGGSAQATFPGRSGKIVVAAKLVAAKPGDLKVEHLDLYLLDPNGGSVRQLTKTPNDDETWPTYSPDGKKIAFVRCRCDFVGHEPELYYKNKASLYVMNADGSGLRRVTSEKYAVGQPSWSPDGKRIAFAEDSGYGGHIYAVSLESGKVVRLTSTRTKDDSPALSPDGTQLAVIRDNAVWVIDLVTGKAVQVSGGGLFNDRPSWSPDGAKLAFGRDWGRYIYDIFTVNADGSGQTRITRGGGDKHWPVWSPDGRSLVYVEVPRASGTYGYTGTVVIAGANGAGPKKLVAPPALMPDWEPVK